MRAVRFDEYGGVDVLEVREVEDPVAGPGEVLVAVRAAGINPGEIAIREGRLHERFPATFPSGEGTDLAGVVQALGDGVSAFAVGDEVLGWTEQRASHAELVVVPDDQLTAKPASVPWEVAGSLFVVGFAAYASVHAVAPQAGETVVVSAAAGGVGSVAVQLARRTGARVIGLAGEHNHDWLRRHDIVPVTYGDGQADRIREASGGTVDAFIDTFGGGLCRAGDRAGCRSAADQHDRRFRGGAATRSPRAGHPCDRQRAAARGARRSGRRRQPGDPDRAHLPAGAGSRRIPRAGCPPQSRQDRAAAVS